jgi:hypothetical protein
MPRAVKLKGGVPGTASWVGVLEDGRIEVEYFVATLERKITSQAM